jgi:peptidoglycan hydrolase CwlO-like protein
MVEANELQTKVGSRLQQRPNQPNRSLRRRTLNWKQPKANSRGAKQAADQAKEQVEALAQKAASLKSELQTSDGQRIELQEKLDKAGSEIERLKSELDQPQRAKSP